MNLVNDMKKFVMEFTRCIKQYGSYSVLAKTIKEAERRMENIEEYE